MRAGSSSSLQHSPLQAICNFLDCRRCFCPVFGISCQPSCGHSSYNKPRPQPPRSSACAKGSGLYGEKLAGKMASSARILTPAAGRMILAQPVPRGSTAEGTWQRNETPVRAPTEEQPWLPQASSAQDSGLEESWEPTELCPPGGHSWSRITSASLSHRASGAVSPRCTPPQQRAIKY